MDDYRVFAHLNITDFCCSPKEITTILGIEPTKVWLAGDRVSVRSTKVHKQHGWRLASPLPVGGVPLSEHIGALKPILLPRQANFARLPKGSMVEFACIVYVRKLSPAIGLSRDDVSLLSAIGASFDVDTYDLRDGDSGRADTESWMDVS